MSHPTHGCGIGRALLCMLAVLGVYSYASDLADWPIGHLKITPGPDDTINVEARCVATADLITQLAALSGTSAVRFDKPCRTYVSVSRPDRYEPPAFWIDLVSDLGRFGTLRENNAWHVRYPSLGNFDASLAEHEIYRTYKKDTSGARPTPAGQGVSSGVLIYDGVFVPPPYLVTTRQNEESGNPEVLVNGLVLSTVPVKSGSKTLSVPALPADGQFEDYDDFLRYTWGVYAEVLARTGSPAEALAASADFARSQDIVEFVEIVAEGLYAPASIKFRTSLHEMGLFPIHYDFDVGGVRESWSDSGLTLEDATVRAEEVRRNIERRLQGATVIVHFRGGRNEFRGRIEIGKFLANVELAATLPVHQAECILAETLSPPILARSLAANLAAGVERGLVSALANALTLASNLERGTMMSAESARHAGTDRPAVDEAATEEDLP
jgi:hypothetical protein